MFDLSLAEMVLVVLVAVVFIGPKELPVVIRAVVKGVRGLRSMMREMRGMFDNLAKESGIMDDVKMIRGDDGKWYEAYDALSSLRAERSNPSMDRHGASAPRDDEKTHD